MLIELFQLAFKDQKNLSLSRVRSICNSKIDQFLSISKQMIRELMNGKSKKISILAETLDIAFYDLYALISHYSQYSYYQRIAQDTKNQINFVLSHNVNINDFHHTRKPINIIDILQSDPKHIMKNDHSFFTSSDLYSSKLIQPSEQIKVSNSSLNELSQKSPDHLSPNLQSSEFSDTNSTESNDKEFINPSIIIHSVSERYQKLEFFLFAIPFIVFFFLLTCSFYIIFRENKFGIKEIRILNTTVFLISELGALPLGLVFSEYDKKNISYDLSYPSYWYPHGIDSIYEDFLAVKKNVSIDSNELFKEFQNYPNFSVIGSAFYNLSSSAYIPYGISYVLDSTGRNVTNIKYYFDEKDQPFSYVAYSLITMEFLYENQNLTDIFSQNYTLLWISTLGKTINFFNSIPSILSENVYSLYNLEHHFKKVFLIINFGVNGLLTIMFLFVFFKEKIIISKLSTPLTKLPRRLLRDIDKMILQANCEDISNTDLNKMDDINEDKNFSFNLSQILSQTRQNQFNYAHSSQSYRLANGLIIIIIFSLFLYAIIYMDNNREASFCNNFNLTILFCGFSTNEILLYHYLLAFSVSITDNGTDFVSSSLMKSIKSYISDIQFNIVPYFFQNNSLSQVFPTSFIMTTPEECNESIIFKCFSLFDTIFYSITHTCTVLSPESYHDISPSGFRNILSYSNLLFNEMFPKYWILFSDNLIKKSDQSTLQAISQLSVCIIIFGFFISVDILIGVSGRLSHEPFKAIYSFIPYHYISAKRLLDQYSIFSSTDKKNQEQILDSFSIFQNLTNLIFLIDQYGCIAAHTSNLFDIFGIDSLVGTDFASFFTNFKISHGDNQEQSNELTFEQALKTQQSFKIETNTGKEKLYFICTFIPMSKFQFENKNIFFACSLENITYLTELHNETSYQHKKLLLAFEQILPKPSANSIHITGKSGSPIFHTSMFIAHFYIQNLEKLDANSIEKLQEIIRQLLSQNQNNEIDFIGRSVEVFRITSGMYSSDPKVNEMTEKEWMEKFVSYGVSLVDFSISLIQSIKSLPIHIRCGISIVNSVTVSIMRIPFPYLNIIGKGTENNWYTDPRLPIDTVNVSSDVFNLLSNEGYDFKFIDEFYQFNNNGVQVFSIQGKIADLSSHFVYGYLS